MATFTFKGFQSSPGDRRITSSHNQSGNLSVERDAVIGRHLTVQGNFYIYGHSDRVLSDTYNHEDPELLLNSEYTGGPMPDIGLRAHRGSSYADGVLKFYSTLPGGYWGVGTVGDVERIARISSTVTTPNALYYDVTSQKIVHNPSIFLEPTQLRTIIPVTVATNIGYSTFTTTVPGGSILLGAIGMTGIVTGETTKTSLLGYKDITYDGALFKISPAYVGLGSMFYEVTSPEDNRTQHVFNNYLAFGRDDSLSELIEPIEPTLINSDTLPLRLESSDELCLKVDSGGNGTDGPRGQIITQPNQVIMTVPLDLQGNSLSVQEIITNKLTTQAIAFQVPPTSTPSFKPIPNIVGWTGSITYDTSTYVESWQEVDNRTKYEVQVDMTIAGGDPGVGQTKSMVFPIDIGGSMDNIRNVYGVIQDKTGGGGTIRVLPIPAIDLEIIPSFQLDPTYLTAGTLTAPINYYFVNYRYVKSVGTWRWVFTVETIHPAISI